MEVFADPDLKEFNDALYKLARATGKDFGFVVKRNARLLAVGLAIYTQPWGGEAGNFAASGKNLKYNGLDDRKRGEAAVRRDIGRVYRTIDIIYEQIKTQSKDSRAARAFYGAAINGKVERAQRILRSLRIFDRGATIGKFDRGAQHQARRNKRGRVSGSRADIIVTDSKKIAIYTKKIERRVGKAKGGWAGAAKDLGGMRGLPQWVTRHKGGGHAEDRTGDTSYPHATLHNDVPYIDAVLNKAGAQQAIDITREKMLTHIEYVVAAQAKKAGLQVTGSVPSQEPTPA